MKVNRQRSLNIEPFETRLRIETTLVVLVKPVGLLVLRCVDFVRRASGIKERDSEKGQVDGDEESLVTRMRLSVSELSRAAVLVCENGEG
jgi:hypothetical protein